MKEELERQSFAIIPLYGRRGSTIDEKKFGSATYMECSSLKEKDDIPAIFEEAVKTVQRQKPRDATAAACKIRAVEFALK